MDSVKPLLSTFLPLLFLSLIFPSCVSKKKYLNEVELRASCDTTLQMLNTRNLTLNREIARLKLELAEQKGTSNAFREILDKKENQISRLEEEIESLSSQSLDQKTLMDGALQQKTRELERRKAQLESFKGEIAKQQEQLVTIIERIKNTLPEIDNNDMTMEIQKGDAHIRISESLIFRKGTTRLNSRAIEILEPIGVILMDYPLMEIMVVGHTDNKPGKTDNWDLSTLRSTAVVKALTKDVGMAPNQIIAAGKGEFKPITSNETPEGRAKNRRTEIVISPSSDLIIKRLKESN